MSIAENLAAIQARVTRACEVAGRDPSSVRLLAVSKTKPESAIHEALAAGQRAFGENYAQELRDKVAAFAEVDPAPEWHFIGHLQRNKVKYAVGKAALIHAVDSEKLARAIGERAARGGLTQAVLVEVNVGGEDSKSGVAPEAALALCEAIQSMDGLTLRGLMTIPPYREDPADVAPFFSRLSALAAEGRAQGLPLDELSMGMSHDFEVAIAHGATLVRVGTAIFGARG